eukprot:7060738-Heterocapsa_arctica.AAC.1
MRKKEWIWDEYDNLGFQGGAVGLPRFSHACGCFERQKGKRGAHIDRGARFAKWREGERA